MWDIVEIYPFWSKEKRITKLRLDFPAPAEGQVDKMAVEIDSIKILDLKLESQPQMKASWTIENGKKNAWDSPMFSLDAERIGNWLTINASADAPRSVEFSWMGERGIFCSTIIELDRQMVNVDLADSKYWKGRVHQFKLRVLPDSESQGAVTFRSVAVNPRPQGPANIGVMFCGIEDAVVRAGYETSFFLDLINNGGEDTPALTFDDIKLPEGVSLTATKGQKTLTPFKVGERRRLLFPVKVAKPVEGTISLKLTASRKERFQAVPVKIPISVLPSLNLPKADYVPKPKPVKSEYEIGALYFPGWYHGHSWSRIWNRCPVRRPLLGWYNESSPEVIDWQIKWSVENGIQYYLVDWYWNKGNQHLEHWIKGFQQARYKSYLKWAMMWANHNGPGSHSLEDQAKVTQYWLDNYFNTPEYYCIDGRPVVMIWSPQGMDRDVIEIEKKERNQFPIHFRFAEVDLGRDAPSARICADEARLLNAFRELIRNGAFSTLVRTDAHRFHSLRGYSRVHVHTSLHHDTILTVIRDNGVGMTESQLRSLRLFAYSENTNGVCFGGRGIGFATACQTMEEHGGQIKVSSDQSGTEVTASLPVLGAEIVM